MTKNPPKSQLKFFFFFFSQLLWSTHSRRFPQTRDAPLTLPALALSLLLLFPVGAAVLVIPPPFFLFALLLRAFNPVAAAVFFFFLLFGAGWMLIDFSPSKPKINDKWLVGVCVLVRIRVRGGVGGDGTVQRYLAAGWGEVLGGRLRLKGRSGFI